MSDEGVVKFRAIRTPAPPLEGEAAGALCAARDRLYSVGLIGALEDGTGYGNASVRVGEEVLVTGTGTGGVEHLLPEHLVVVERCAIRKNTVWCRGPIDPSSETMTHMAAYAGSQAIAAVVHGHHNEAWSTLCGTVPTIDVLIPYGTPEMADAVERLVRESYSGNGLLIAMAGHEGGLLAVASTLDAAVSVLIDGVFGSSSLHSLPTR